MLFGMVKKQDKKQDVNFVMVQENQTQLIFLICRRF